MYCAHFGFHRPPFNNTPDPSFYYGTPEHEEALATLEYATLQRKGFVLLTGEVGAGKTMIGRMFLRRIEPRARTAVITHTQLSGKQLLAALCSELDIPVPAEAGSLQLTERLHAFLLEQYAHDRLVVVLLDEAQNLPDESFEAVRMLGNLEADDAKLIQVCILGQPELRARFERPNLRQLDQRLFHRFHLNALTSEQTGDYVAHRLRMAGWNGGELFTQAALDRIFAASQGMPRLINRLCDNALLTAYGRGQRMVDADIIEEIAGPPVEVPKSAPCSLPHPRSNATDAVGSENPSPQQPEEPGGRVAEWVEALADQVAGSGGRIEELQAHITAQKNEIETLAGQVTGSLEEVRRQLAELHENTATHGDLERTSAQQTETLVAIRDAHDHALEDLRSALHLHESGLQALNDRLHQQATVMEQAMQSLWEAAATREDLQRTHAQQTALLENMRHRLACESEALARLQQDLERRTGALSDEQRAAREELSRRVLVQARWVRDLRHRLATMQAAIEGRLNVLAGDVREGARMLAELDARLNQRGSEIQALNTQTKARIESLAGALRAQGEQAAGREELEQLRENLVSFQKHTQAQSQEMREHLERQQQRTGALQQQLDQQKEAVRARFDEVLTHWRQTREELFRLAKTGAPAEELAALARRQESDTQTMLAALATQRGELEALVEAVSQRCESLAARLEALPRKLVGVDQLETVQAEHAEQIRGVFERMDIGRSEIDAAVQEVAASCRQALEQIEVLAERAATHDDVAAVQETHARDLEAVLQRLDHSEKQRQGDLNDFNRRWDELAGRLQALAGLASSPDSVRALEENLSELRDRVDTDRRRQQEDMRSLVRNMEQLSSRLAAVEGNAPVKIELSPGIGRELGELIERARVEREELARMAQTAETARRELAQAVEPVERALKQWGEEVTAIDQKSGELRASVGAAGKLLKAMQRAQQILEERINSYQWKSELARGEGLAARLERAAGEAGSACDRLQAALRNFDDCRDDADVWTARCAEARQVAETLARLLAAGKQAGQKLESELSHRKRVLNAIARNTAGLVEAIEAARRADEAVMGRAQPVPQRERLNRSDERNVPDDEWPRMRGPVDRLRRDSLVGMLPEV